MTHCVAFTHLAVKDAHQNRDPKIPYFLAVLASVFGDALRSVNQHGYTKAMFSEKY